MNRSFRKPPMQVYLTSNEVKLLSEIWHLRCGQRWLGPYSYPELCLMLNSKNLTRHQFVRTCEHQDWIKMTDLECFNSKSVESFLTSYSPRSDAQKIRSHVRIELESFPIVLIKDSEIIQGKCVQVSAGGAKIEIPFGKLKIKDQIKLHFPFHPKLKIKSFNTDAEILRTDKLTIVHGQNEIETLSLKFISLRPKYKKQILYFVRKEVRKIYQQMKVQENMESQIDFVNLGIRRSDIMMVNSKNSPVILVG